MSSYEEGAGLFNKIDGSTAQKRVEESGNGGLEVQGSSAIMNFRTDGHEMLEILHKSDTPVARVKD